MLTALSLAQLFKAAYALSGTWKGMSVVVRKHMFVVHLVT